MNATRELQAATFRTHRNDIAAIVASMVPPEHHGEAMEEGTIGLLIALEKHDPASGPFWPYAEQWVKNEIQRWLDIARPVDVEALPPLRRSRWQTARPALHRNEAEREAFVMALADRASGLTEKEREAVTAVFVEGRSMRAAAAHLGVPFATLRARVQMARATLRIWLGRAGVQATLRD